MGMAAPTYWTAEMVRQLPDDGNRYEVVAGELLVTPAPRTWHQVLVGRLYLALATYLAHEPAGYVLFSPADVSLAPDTLVQPDVFVVPVEQVRRLEWTAIRDLLLVVEVLSPSTGRADRFTKRRWYQEVGVPVVWLVDPEAEVVEVWTPEMRAPLVERNRLTWHPSRARSPLTIDVKELFRPL